MNPGLMVGGLIAALCAGEMGTAQDTDLRLRLAFDVDDPPGLYALLQTTRSFPCAGSQLRTVVTHERDTISIRVAGPVRPVPCMSVMEEAEGRGYLGNQAGGSYVLRVIYDGEEDLYHLSVDGRIYELLPVVQTFTTITH